MGLCPHIVSGFTNSGVRDYGLGASVGYKVMDNMWLSLGYNVRGLNDRDFTAAAYPWQVWARAVRMSLNDRDFTAAAYLARGLYVTLRMKLDQDTLGLNRRDKTIQPMTAEK